MPLTLTGCLICVSQAEREIVVNYLPEHIRLTREEPGCQLFEVTQSAKDPMIWELRERFVDRAAFEAHQARNRASAWGAASAGITRDYQISED